MNNARVLTGLHSLRNLFDRPGSHCRRMMARGPHGRTHVGDPAATSFCLQGGVFRAVDEESRLFVIGALGKTLETRGARNTSLTAWNDTTGRNRQNVLDLIDATVARLQQG